MQTSLFLTRIDKLSQVLRSKNLLRALVRNRVLAGAEHRQVLRSDLATVIDIGANRGQFALAVRQWAPGAKVIAFEPLPRPAARFRKVFQGDARVILHQAAIGSEAGKATIHVSHRDDSSSLLAIGAMQERLFPGTGEARTETVSVGRLPDFVSADEIVSPAMLKFWTCRGSSWRPFADVRTYYRVLLMSMLNARLWSCIRGRL
ncbi:MAG: FkbM family methyltransferase [Desulfobacterales bacterium]|nr:FkbM family methyltransferase [Desulfobacterales bacterium]